MTRARARRDVLLIVDVQPAFAPPPALVEGVRRLLPVMPSAATVERHDEQTTPFRAQLNWAPPANETCLVEAQRVFVKHGYSPTRACIDYLQSLEAQRVLVCGVQADTCVLAAGFALFDAGLHPTLIADLVAGSSLDRSGELGRRLWRHHFGAVVDSHRELLEPAV